MLKYPDRHYTRSIEDSFTETERQQLAASKSAILTRIRSQSSVHTLLIEAKEAYERWNLAYSMIQNPPPVSEPVYGLLPPLQLAVSSFNYFEAIAEINSRAHKDNQRVEADSRLEQQGHWVNFSALFIGLLGLILAALTYFGYIPTAGK